MNANEQFEPYDLHRQISRYTFTPDNVPDLIYKASLTMYHRWMLTTIPMVREKRYHWERTASNYSKSIAWYFFGIIRTLSIIGCDEIINKVVTMYTIVDDFAKEMFEKSLS